MERVYSTYLEEVVELTDEREAHICKRHPDLLPVYKTQLLETMTDPDEVLTTPDPDKRLFVRWYNNIRGGKYVIAVILTENTHPHRHWVVTAYLDSMPPGDV